MQKNAVEPINNIKNKLNGEIIFIYNFNQTQAKCAFGNTYFFQFILLFSLFLLLFMGPTTLVLFMSLTIIFQLIFIFIYSNFNKKLSVPTK